MAVGIYRSIIMVTMGVTMVVLIMVVIILSLIPGTGIRLIIIAGPSIQWPITGNGGYGRDRQTAL
jgi:hypothetical protein